MPVALPLTELDTGIFKGLLQTCGDICTLEVTVPTGMEDVCAEEAAQKLGVKAVVATGRVFFDIALPDINKVLLLRSAENIHVVILMEKKFPFSTDREECFEQLFHMAERPLWRKGVRVWQEVFGALQEDAFTTDRPLNIRYQEPNPVLDLRLLKKSSPVALNLPEDIKKLRESSKCFADIDSKTQENTSKTNNADDTEQTHSAVEQCASHIDEPHEEQPINRADSLTKHAESADQPPPISDKSSSESCPDKILKNDCVATENCSSSGVTGLSFRVSCTRAGESHVFGSPEAARQLGAAINDRFDWTVDLKKYRMEVILTIHEDMVFVCLALTRTPLYKRSLVSFGPTNLRATLCYALVHLARPRLGDTVLDHMCGGAAVPIEGALSFPGCFFLGGEIHALGVARSRENLDHNASQHSLAADVARWDATRLPLRDTCVDVVVSDLPFGKRSGSRYDNRVLYLRSLLETARVTRPDTGRAVLLTHDRNSMLKNLVKVKQYWRNSSTRTINIGGLAAAVFLLHRTNALYSPRSVLNSNDKS